MKQIVVIIFLIPLKALSGEVGALPYGAYFGQIFNPSEHKTIQRRGNIKSVLLKTADRPDDTERLSAEICDGSGLQILTWQSHIRSLVSATSSHKEILRDFKKKYGKPQIKKKSAFWATKELQIVVKIRSKNKTYQNQIRYFGPQYEPCFEEFKKYKNVLQNPHKRINNNNNITNNN